MTLKTGHKCNWKEIEVGEVFAYSGCWVIGCKISDKEFFVLDSDFFREFAYPPSENRTFETYQYGHSGVLVS